MNEEKRPMDEEPRNFSRESTGIILKLPLFFYAAAVIYSFTWPLPDSLLLLPLLVVAAFAILFYSVGVNLLASEHVENFNKWALSLLYFVVAATVAFVGYLAWLPSSRVIDFPR